MATSHPEHMSLDSFPNEILAHVLSLFSTRDLLPLARVSHRLEAVIAGILRHRLRACANPKDYQVILECYHPSCKATEPYSVCSYLGTQQLDARHGGETLSSLAPLGTQYSRFRPCRRELDMRLRARRRYGAAVPIVSGGGAALFSGPRNGGDNNGNDSGGGDDDDDDDDDGSESIPPAASITVMLDGFEPFSNLCVDVHLLGRSIFTTCFDLVGGIVRLWREWLEEQGRSSTSTLSGSGAGELVGSSSGREYLPSQSDDAGIIWIDRKKNVGIKVRVEELNGEREVPVLMHQDETLPTRYEVVFEELLVRTTHLLLSVESAAEAELEAPRKAVIFGTILAESH